MVTCSTGASGRPAIGFVVGLAAEARIAARCGHPVATGGGRPEGAFEAARSLVAAGATALISFGLAGGLDPRLRPGTLLLPSHILHESRVFATDAALGDCFGGLTGHKLLAGSSIVADASAKLALFQDTGAHAVDLESGAVAAAALAHAVPFAVVRAICDPAQHSLPPAALTALDPSGGITWPRILASLARQPAQLGGLMRLGRDAAAARRSLIEAVARFRHAGTP